MDIFRRACDVLPLSNLECLAIYFPYPTQINWSGIFQHSTKVTTVKVYGRGTIGLLEALTPPKLASTMACRKERKREYIDDGRGAQAQAPGDDHDDDDGPAPVHVPIFPKLTSLSLEELDFTDEVPASGVVYDLIMSVVQRRKAKGMSLTTLRIECCMIRKEQAEALEGFVSDFQWDHDYYEDSDDDEGNRGDHDEYYDDEVCGLPDDGNSPLSMTWGGLLHLNGWPL